MRGCRSTVLLAHSTRIALGLTLCLAGFLLSGCKPPQAYTMEVDAISKPNLKYPMGTTVAFQLPPAVMQNEDIADEVVLAQLERAFQGRGFAVVEMAEAADLLVTVDFSISAARVRPVGTVLLERRRYSTWDSGAGLSHGGRAESERFDESDRGATPAYEELDFEQEALFVKQLALSARNASDGQEEWNVVVETEDAGNYLSDYLSLLIAASMDHLASQTEDTVEVKLKADSSDVRYVEASSTAVK